MMSELIARSVRLPESVAFAAEEAIRSGQFASLDELVETAIGELLEPAWAEDEDRETFAAGLKAALIDEAHDQDAAPVFEQLRLRYSSMLKTDAG